MEQVRTFDTENTPLGRDYEALEGVSLKFMSFSLAAGLALLALGWVTGAAVAERAYIVEREKTAQEILYLRAQVHQEQAIRRHMERSMP